MSRHVSPARSQTGRFRNARSWWRPAEQREATVYSIACTAKSPVRPGRRSRNAHRSLFASGRQFALGRRNPATRHFVVSEQRSSRAHRIAGTAISPAHRPVRSRNIPRSPADGRYSGPSHRPPCRSSTARRCTNLRTISQARRKSPVRTIAAIWRGYASSKRPDYPSGWRCIIRRRSARPVSEASSVFAKSHNTVQWSGSSAPASPDRHRNRYRTAA